MCNLYTMTATVDELRRVFGSFDGHRENLPPFNVTYPGKPAPVLRRDGDGFRAASPQGTHLSIRLLELQVR